MAKKNQHRKKKNNPNAQQLTPIKYLMEKAAGLPCETWYINEDWQTSGLAVIYGTRIMPSGNLICANYLVDIFCLGVKDTAWYFNISPSSYKESVRENYDGAGLKDIEINPNLAQNIIYGAVEYAESLGFSPHKDFNITEYLLSPADEIPFIEIPFGQNGQPLYISGPFDNVRLILKKLEKAVGKGNFKFILNTGLNEYGFDDWLSDDDEEDDDEDYDDDDEEYTDYEEVDSLDK